MIRASSKPNCKACLSSTGVAQFQKIDGGSLAFSCLQNSRDEKPDTAQEQKHADSVGTQIHSLGRQIPEVIPVHVEKNRIWQYLRTDLDEEERLRT